MRSRRLLIIIATALLIQSVCYIDSFKLLGMVLFFVLLISFLSNGIMPMLLFVVFLPNQRLLTFSDGGISMINAIPFLMLFLKINTLVNKKWLIWLFSFSSLGILLVYLKQQDFFVYFAITKYIITMMVIVQFLRSVDYSGLINIARAFVLGPFVMVSTFILTNGLTLNSRFSAGDFNNPNIISLYFATALIILLDFKKIFSNKVRVGLILLYFLFGLLTKSNSFLLISLFLIVSRILITLNRSRSWKQLSILGGMSLLTLLSIDISKLEVFERVFNPKNDDISNGRLVLWQKYSSFLTDNWSNFLWGNSNVVSFNFETNDQVAHNSVLETVYSFGFIFLLVHLLFVFWIYKSVSSDLSGVAKRKMLIALAVLFLHSFTGHSYVNLMYGTLTFLLMFLYMKLTKIYSI